MQLLLIGLVSFLASAQTTAPASYTLDAMPAGYRLQACDDCGVETRQPHVKCAGVHTYLTYECDADVKARTVAWDYKQLDVVYDKLNPAIDYVVAVLYANETFNTRVQSIWAGPIQLQAPHALPKGKSERLIFKIPREAVQQGKLTLSFKLEGAVNVVVSAVELWAPLPPVKALYMVNVNGLQSDLEGQALNLAYDPQGGATIELVAAGQSKPLATTETRADGWFTIPRSAFESVDHDAELELKARHDGLQIQEGLAANSLFFNPVRYRPIPVSVNSLNKHVVLLDGEWRINTAPTSDVRRQPLTAAGWGKFTVPGQWVQQGYDVPQDKTVAVAHEFTVPAEWKNHRVFLRFDAVHAGTHYRLNGELLGYSENLYTPVEWDITKACRIGESNRIDLDMKVDTISEQLSYSCGYAFHNLGGIDRSVRIYALPPTHIRTLRILTDLDKEYRDAEFTLTADLEQADQKNLEAVLTLKDTDGKPVMTASSAPDNGILRGTYRITNPYKWSDEKPYLYTLTLELKQDDKVLERIERSLGFRKIEIRQRQMYVNGKRIKLAGACRHEIDPLTGRANTMRHAEQDVKLLKAANLNYIRTSHYPPCQEMLDAADRIGMYVEVEAPLCWLRDIWEMDQTDKILTPTSAMIDYCHTHPSVTLWSLANESAFCRFFKNANSLCKTLDPTRPTTFNFPDPWKICDIANFHYPAMPYDEAAKSEPERPVLLGEYYFPVCHEQTDVNVNPGLRGLWAAGFTDPDSAYGKECATVYAKPVYLMPGAPPGMWTHVYRSDAVIGGAIWAALDEPFYLPGGKKVGFMWKHGPWGLIDAWRRPKPEWWLSKLVFSPVWFPKRQVELAPGQKEIRLPVENRLVFTDLSELNIAWSFGEQKGKVNASLPPATSGEITIPVPQNAKAGDPIQLTITDAKDNLLNTLLVQLGKAEPQPLPQPKAGVPKWNDDGKSITVEGNGFAFVLDRKTGTLQAEDAGHKTSVIRFPTMHVSRFDFGDLKEAPAYAVLPESKTRAIESITADAQPQGLAITVKERYDLFTGSITWLIDRDGFGKITYDYTYDGPDMFARELGIRMLLSKDCDEIRWRRWSEWGVYPENDIGRPLGQAQARRDAKWPEQPESVRPDWPWFLDQTELGTNDFRACKFNIYEASLTAADGKGLRIHANADAHVRACLDKDGVMLHILSECKIGPAALKKGDRVAGERIVELRSR